MLVSLAALIAEKLDDPYNIKDDVKLAVEVDGDFDWETMLSVTSKGAVSKFAALVAGKQGTAAAGGREGSQGATNRWSKHKSNWVWCISMTSTDSVHVAHQLAIHTTARSYARSWLSCIVTTTDTRVTP